MARRTKNAQPTATKPAKSANQEGKQPHADSDKTTRRGRNREAMRKKLISAAQTVIAQNGFESTTINDITEEADVGFGSFYNYFSSISEVATIVFETRAEEIAKIGDMVAEREKDPAVTIAYIQRILLTRAVADPIWGWFVVNATNSLPEMTRIFLTHGKRDIERGIEAGRFSVSNADAAMRIILSALLGTMRAILEEDTASTTVAETIELLLRMLGVEETDARVISQKKLPKYISFHFAPSKKIIQ